MLRTSQCGSAFISQYGYWLVSSPRPFGGASRGDIQPGVPAVVESPMAMMRTFIVHSLVCLEERRGRSALCLQAPGNLLDLAPDPQDVLSRDLLDVRVRVAAAQQLRGQRRILRHVVEPEHDLGDPVEVAAEADV